MGITKSMPTIETMAYYGVYTAYGGVNVSARQFHLADFAMDVANILHEEDLSPKYLELELTESLVMEKPDKIILMLHVLNSLGVKLSIDDFGTGYSSLSYLQKFPIDILKIDRSFIREISSQNENGAAITLAIISMAHMMKLSVVAEGVETEVQKEFLQKNGCEQLQGYYLSHPLPEEDVISLLEQNQK